MKLSNKGSNENQESDTLTYDLTGFDKEKTVLFEKIPNEVDDEDLITIISP